ncbi:MAG: Gfo/Idh/MocA family oxidoreductase, partial [Planctomycetales bacterium]|nr:Gfo/Idh/MocA family oxidoreductase [Planctomycetales bacterium]
MKLRVGVVGLGDAWNSRHRPALHALNDRYEVRAVCSEVSLLTEQAAREFNAAPVDGFRTLIARDDIDAVLVLSSEWYGPQPILAACDYGKAVYCASPLDIEPDRAIEVRDRLEEAGIAFMAEFPRRLSPATLRLKELIATRLGRPRLLFCHTRALDKPDPTRRHLRAKCPETMRSLMELVDWCCYVVDREPSSVFGVLHRETPDGFHVDYQMMSLDFSPQGNYGTDALAQISCGRYMPANWPEAIAFRRPSEMQVRCERGIAFIDLPSTLVWFDEAGRHMESLESDRPVGEQLLTQFHRAVTSLVRKTTDLDDAYRALNIVMASTTSCTMGRREPLDFLTTPHG